MALPDSNTVAMIYGKGVYALVEVWTHQNAARDVPAVF